jgi:hypothetical protein
LVANSRLDTLGGAAAPDLKGSIARMPEEEREHRDSMMNWLHLSLVRNWLFEYLPKWKFVLREMQNVAQFHAGVQATDCF